MDKRHKLYNRTHSNVCLVIYKYGLVQSDVVYSLTTKWRQSTCNMILRLHELFISRHPFKLIFSFIYTVLGGSVHQEPSVFFNIKGFLVVCFTIIQFIAQYVYPGQLDFHDLVRKPFIGKASSVAVVIGFNLVLV